MVEKEEKFYMPPCPEKFVSALCDMLYFTRMEPKELAEKIGTDTESIIMLTTDTQIGKRRNFELLRKYPDPSLVKADEEVENLSQPIISVAEIKEEPEVEVKVNSTNIKPKKNKKTTIIKTKKEKNSINSRIHASLMDLMS